MTLKVDLRQCKESKIKKTVDTVKKKFGKTPYRPSRDEIKSNQYRQSKGLSPLNFEKMKKKG